MLKTTAIFLKGMAMGTADVIPGVSGGTLALIMGIYERLIAAIKGIGPSLVLDLLKNLNLFDSKKRQIFFKTCKEKELFFLVTLAVGILTAAVIAGNIIPGLMIDHTEAMFSIFLGLIIPSLFVPWSMIKRHSVVNVMILLGGTALTVYLSFYLKSHGGLIGNSFSFAQTALLLFLCAMIAISAMILPGISGSYILMLLGQYLFVTGLIYKLQCDLLSRAPNIAKPGKYQAYQLVEQFSTLETIALIGCFILGCIVGVILFSRVIHFALDKAHDATMAFLTGMILSSVYVIWPFKIKPTDPALLSMGKGKWLPLAHNTMPEWAQSTTKTAIIFFLISLILSTSVIVIGRKRQKNS